MRAGGLALEQTRDSVWRYGESVGYELLNLIVLPMRTSIVATFDVLPGLPPYGDPPDVFTATGQGGHREGYVVRFYPDDSAPWVGNFAAGISSFDGVVPHPDGRHLIVVAGGQGYVVDPNNRFHRAYFGGSIEIALPVPELSSVLFGDGLWFELLARDGLLWRSRRISWDGMRGICREGLRLFGEAWSPIEDCWLPFELDMNSGECAGGSYNGPGNGAELV